MFSPVQPEEMAFALTLFVSAASGQLSAGRKPLTIENMREGQKLFLSFAFHDPRVAQSSEIDEVLSGPLFAAFLLVWEHYKADPGQASLGARLLGFYYLMTETRGAALEDWVSPSASEEALVELHPQVVETLATMRLQASGRLDREAFLGALRFQRSRLPQQRHEVAPSTWPVGTGSMATMVREHDWSSNALGAVNTWPQGLRTAVELVLACRFPMVVLWGELLTQIYNDAYCNIMGRKHPAGLGQPTAECWPEVWHINRPNLRKVLQGETLPFEDGLYPIRRDHNLEDAYFTLCYSPLREEAGTIQGVLVTVFETTERVQAEKAALSKAQHY